MVSLPHCRPRCHSDRVPARYPAACSLQSRCAEPISAQLPRTGCQDAYECVCACDSRLCTSSRDRAARMKITSGSCTINATCFAKRAANLSIKGCSERRVVNRVGQTQSRIDARWGAAAVEHIEHCARQPSPRRRHQPLERQLHRRQRKKNLRQPVCNRTRPEVTPGPSVPPRLVIE